MPRVAAGEVGLRYVEQGSGAVPIVCVHGNLGCLEWFDLVRAQLAELRMVAYDWRGAGESDKPLPGDGFERYRMEDHARDLLALLDALSFERCHILAHSTGALIATHALRAAPERFGRVLLLDPVTPRGLRLAKVIGSGLYEAMKADRSVAFAALARAAPSLFVPASLAWGQVPMYAESASPEQRAQFERCIDRTRALSDGIWFGCIRHLDAASRDDQGLWAALPGMPHPHHLVWGRKDAWIPAEDVAAMASALPRATLQVVEQVGHSMNLEDPQGLAAIARAFLS